MKSQPKTHPPPLHPQVDKAPGYDPHDFLARPASHPHHGHTLYTYPQDVDQSYVHSYYRYLDPSHRQLSLSLPYPTIPSYPISGGAFSCTPNPSTNTTTNPNASSYSTRQPPPPPASAPELPATGAGTGNGERSGFQVDYTRVSSREAVRRPRIVLEADEFQKMIVLRKGGDSKGADHNEVGEIRPPPLEAYIVLRPHRVPKIVDLDEKKVSRVGTGKGMGTKGKRKEKEKGKKKVIREGKGEAGVGWDDGIPGDIPTFEKWYVPHTFRRSMPSIRAREYKRIIDILFIGRMSLR